MRILMVNTSAKSGGAAVAASRLRDALISHGVKVKMLVMRKDTHHLSVVALRPAWLQRWHFLWERWQIFCANRWRRDHLFEVDIATCGTDITSLPEFKEADVIHLHWVNQGMLSLRSIKKILCAGKPVVWTLHDLWPMTGICHYPHACTRYETACGDCPFLVKSGARDWSHRVWTRKKRVFESGCMEFVAVSHWLEQCARKSSLLSSQKVTVIPNVISLSHFSLRDRGACRKALGIDEQCQVILFGAARIDTPIKGFHLLVEALQKMVNTSAEREQKPILLLFGALKSPEVLTMLPIPYIYKGVVGDETILSQLYGAADVVVNASLYETFGQTLIEAQACGCLPVTFGGDGREDIIEHRVNGFLAAPGSTESLAEGIAWALQTPVDPYLLREGVVKRYSEDVVSKQYLALYEQAMRKEE